jgi:3-methyladenine DNA glycosylase/8-oxoguanine DNA glycosylase
VSPASVAATAAAPVAGAAAEPPVRRRYRPSGPLDLRATLAPHRHGAFDPCQRVDALGAHWRIWRTPQGPATLRLAADPGAAQIDVQAWGSGAAWALDAVPALLGADDDWSGFEPPAGVLRDTHRRTLGMRLSRSGLVFEALVPAILEQLVTSTEAQRSWRELVRRYGSAAPGAGAAPGSSAAALAAPSELRVAPGPAAIAAIPDWEWHAIGLDGRRRHAVIAAVRVASRIDDLASLSAADAVAKLMSLPGVGAWTAAEVVQRSHGAADVVSAGDYHLANAVGYVLTGRPRSTDDEMLVLLEPYRLHRQRVVRLVEACGVRAPRYGPRMAPRDFRRS